ncbi:MAG: hypothetical protein ACFFDN_47570 [Candidatus Hodarchaeota archaeon]
MSGPRGEQVGLWLRDRGKVAAKGLPSTIKKWEVYGTFDGLNGLKSYHLIKTDREKTEEALMEVSKLFAPAYMIDGLNFRVEVLSGVKGAAEFMKWIK